MNTRFMATLILLLLTCLLASSCGDAGDGDPIPTADAGVDTQEADAGEWICDRYRTLQDCAQSGEYGDYINPLNAKADEMNFDNEPLGDREAYQCETDSPEFFCLTEGEGCIWNTAVNQEDLRARIVCDCSIEITEERIARYCE